MYLNKLGFFSLLGYLQFTVACKLLWTETKAAFRVFSPHDVQLPVLFPVCPASRSSLSRRLRTSRRRWYLRSSLPPLAFLLLFCVLRCFSEDLSVPPPSSLWSSCGRGIFGCPLWKSTSGLFTIAGRRVSRLTSCFVSVPSRHNSFRGNNSGTPSVAEVEELNELLGVVTELLWSFFSDLCFVVYFN